VSLKYGNVWYPKWKKADESLRRAQKSAWGRLRLENN